MLSKKVEYLYVNIYKTRQKSFSIKNNTTYYLKHKVHIFNKKWSLLNIYYGNAN